MIQRRHAQSVCLIDCWIGGNHRQDPCNECFGDTGPVLLVPDLVGDHDNSSLTLFLGNGDGPASDVDRAERWFDYNNCRINCSRCQASQRANAGFEVGDDRCGLVVH